MVRQTIKLCIKKNLIKFRIIVNLVLNFALNEPQLKFKSSQCVNFCTLFFKKSTFVPIKAFIIFLFNKRKYFVKRSCKILRLSFAKIFSKNDVRLDLHFVTVPLQKQKKKTKTEGFAQNPVLMICQLIKIERLF